MEQGQETDTENKERGGGLRALDGNEGGRNAACQEAAKINLIYIILAIYKADKIFKKKYFISFQIMNYYITYIKKCISI